MIFRAVFWACIAGLWAASALAAEAADAVKSARYTEPTTRYAHGVLGDAVEWGALEMVLQSGKRVTVTLPQSRVFEDLAPRVQDLDGDGAAEVIVVETEARTGAQLAIYDQTGKVTATPHIGRSNRWLSPVGAADIDGDGITEVMFVDRPHLRKSLEVYKYQDRALTPWVSFASVTNHRIGEDFISGGIRNCGGNPQIVVASANWSEVLTLRWIGGYLSPLKPIPFTGPESFAQALAC